MIMLENNGNSHVVSQVTSLLRNTNNLTAQSLSCNFFSSSFNPSAWVIDYPFEWRKNRIEHSEVQYRQHWCHMRNRLRIGHHCLKFVHQHSKPRRSESRLMLVEFMWLPELMHSMCEGLGKEGWQRRHSLIKFLSPPPQSVTPFSGGHSFHNIKDLLAEIQTQMTAWCECGVPKGYGIVMHSWGLEACFGRRGGSIGRASA